MTLARSAPTPTGPLGVSAVEAIAALCRRSLDRPPSAAELAQCLFAPDQPATVRGDPDVGVVVAVRTEAGGFIRLLVVDPAHQAQGHGTVLLHSAEDDLRSGRNGDIEITVGADPPYYLFPGVETNQLAMVCLLERHHYARHDANFNMDVDLSRLPPDPPGPVLAVPADKDELDRFMSTQWPAWRDEVIRALDHGTLLIDRDAEGISAFCAWDVNRGGLLGPVAARHDLIGKGVGAALIVGALHHMRRAGWERVEVAWVGPVVPYARVGGTIGRVFLVYRKTLRAT